MKTLSHCSSRRPPCQTKPGAKPEDEYLANRAINLRQNYEVECR